MKRKLGFSRLVGLTARLRGTRGCPWDRAQDFRSLSRHVKEEANEVIQAMRGRDWEGLKEELGDLLLQVVFASRIAEEEGHFDIADVLRGINGKLTRRHPHVFGDARARTPEEALRHWNRMKASEKKAGGRTRRRKSGRAARASR